MYISELIYATDFKFDGRDVYLWSNLSGLFLSDENNQGRVKWKSSDIGSVLVVYLIDPFIKITRPQRENICACSTVMCLRCQLCCWTLVYRVYEFILIFPSRLRWSWWELILKHSGCTLEKKLWNLRKRKEKCWYNWTYFDFK